MSILGSAAVEVQNLPFRTPSKRYYRPELDALRFFAFACVFLCHQEAAGRWIGIFRQCGAYGMCMFFMLSAYLIFTILLREKDATGTVSWKGFAARRVLRIWPLYFAVLFGAYLLGLCWSQIHISGQAVFAFSFLLGNVYILSHGWIVGPISPLWSLSVEEQFYVCVPIVFRREGKKLLTILCVFVIAFSYATLAWIGASGELTGLQLWLNSFVQFQFFAAGGLIALSCYRRKIALPIFARCAIAAGGLGLWLAASISLQHRSWFSGATTQAVCEYVLVLTGTCSIFVSMLDLQVRIPKALIYLGKISYGLYIFHEAIISLAFDVNYHSRKIFYLQHHKLISAPIVFGVTVATAALSYHYFEQPILKYKQKFEIVHTRPV